VRLAGLAFLFVFLACACGSVFNPSQLTIGAVYPLAGPQSQGGSQELAGLRAALQVAQDEGLLRRPVNLRVISVQTPNEARAAVDSLIDQYHVPIIAGTYGSTLAEAAAAEADQRRVVYWETGAVADNVTQHRNYVFRTVATGMTLGTTAVQFTHDVLMPAIGETPSQSRAVIVSVDDTYGQSVADGESLLAKSLGIPVVDRISYDAHHYDAHAIAVRVAADVPDYLWDVSYLTDGVDIWRAVHSAAVPLRAAIGTSSAFCMPGFGQALGADAVGVFAADKPDDSVNPAALTSGARGLLAKAKRAYAAQGVGASMEIPGVAGFAGGWALFHGVLPRVRGETTPDAVRTAAYQLDEPAYTSVNGGGVKFAPPGAPNAGQNLRAPSNVEEWVSSGVTRAVYPSAFATGNPIIKPR
jgi:branched-chain amino acid transport system substrate-binding protein